MLVRLGLRGWLRRVRHLTEACLNCEKDDWTWAARNRVYILEVVPRTTNIWRRYATPINYLTLRAGTFHCGLSTVGRV